MGYANLAHYEEKTYRTIVYTMGGRVCVGAWLAKFLQRKMQRIGNCGERIFVWVDGKLKLMLLR